MRDRYNIVPVFLALCLHAVLAAGLVFVFDFSRPAAPAVPLAIKATLVQEQPRRRPEPPPRKPEPEPVVEPEPEPVKEAEPEPDVAEQERLRAAAEEARRQQDLQAERDRIAREQAAERERQRKADAERKRREEEELERRRKEAERLRLEEIERQRLENERRRREAEEAEQQRRLQEELDAEQARLDAMNAGAMARYMYALQQKIERNWVQPPSAGPGTNCVVNVTQLPSGEVVRVVVESCNGDENVKRSVEAAVQKASPLPRPEDPSLFERNLRFIFEPTQ